MTKLVLRLLDGPRGETRTLTAIHRRILNPLRLPFRHLGITICTVLSETEESFRSMPQKPFLGNFRTPILQSAGSDPPPLPER